MSDAITTQQLARRFELLDPAQKKRVYDLVDHLLNKRRAAGAVSRKQLLLGAPVWTEEDVQRIREVQQDIDSWRIPS
jgi:hypothetical protein